MEDYSLMENEQFKQTKFDSMVSNKNMQLLKAVIPYIDNPMGNYLGMYIKLKELQNAAHINFNFSVNALNTDKHSTQSKMENMLSDIKEFLSDEEKETIDTVMSVMEMMSMDDDTKNAFMGNYMDMFYGDMFGDGTSAAK
jgi:hypothetical protein